MTLKELKERKAELLDSMSDITVNVEIFDSVKFNEYKKELLEIEDKIKEFDNSKEIIINKKEKESDKMSELYNKLMNGAEVNLNEVKNEAHTTENVEELIQDTYASQIERKLRDKCVLYDRARKIVTASPHIIPVEVKALDKFVKVAELGEYAKQQAQFGQIKLGAVKFGTMLQISEELLADEDYNLEAVLMEMLQEAFADTVMELIAKGDVAEGIEGLAQADKSKGAKEVIVDKIDDEAVIDLMFALDRPHREEAIFVISDEVARKLCKVKDEEGRPLLQLNAIEKPFLLEGADGVLKGKPVVICNAIEKDMYFVNMEKAMVVGVRKNMTVKKSEEAGFMDDSVFIKANCRLDMKILQHEAIAFLVIAE